jgi:gag-polyprotein putative aspartyl protease
MIMRSLPVILFVCACATVPSEVPGQAQQLAAMPGSIWSGAPLGLNEPTVINERDFVYALAFSPDGKEIAFTHHVSTDMELTVTGVNPLTPRFQAKINSSEFDNEDAAFAGNQVLVVSRQGTLRAFDRVTGKLLREVATGVPLLRIAMNDDATTAVVGASNGLLFIFDAATLQLRASGRAHNDEVRGVAWLKGAVISVALDGVVARSQLSTEPPTTTRLPSANRLGRQVFLVHLPDGRAIAAAIDARQQSTTTTRAAARRLKLSLRDDAPTLPIITPEGASTAPAVEIGTLHIQTIELDGLQAAICDACVPPNVELLLGQDVLARMTLSEDVAAGEMVAKPIEGVAGIRFRSGASTMTTTLGPPLPGPANDLQVAHGQILVLNAALISTTTKRRASTLHGHRSRGLFCSTRCRWRSANPSPINTKASRLPALYRLTARPWRPAAGTSAWWCLTLLRVRW